MVMEQNSIQIRQGEEIIYVEMTVKEALALTGAKFNLNHKLERDAIKKVKQRLEDKLLPPNH
jgi:ABC-type Na+ transport system ATPase subunit NatA